MQQRRTRRHTPGQQARAVNVSDRFWMREHNALVTRRKRLIRIMWLLAAFLVMNAAIITQFVD